MWIFVVLIFLLLLSSKRFVNFLLRVIVWSLEMGFDND
jgi:hypothetical protein